jgi:WD40 repeat protein
MKNVMSRILVLVFVACSASVCDGQARDASSGDPGNIQVRYFTGCRHCAAFSPDGKYILTDESDGAELYSSGGELLTTLSKHEREWGDDVTSAAFSPDGTRVATGTGGGSVAVWTLSGSLEAEFGNCSGRQVSCLAFSPDGRWIATGSTDNQVCLLSRDGLPTLTFTIDPDLNRSNPVYQLFAYIDSLCFSPDGRLLAVSAGEVVRLWDVSGAEPVAVPDFLARGSWTAFSPNGGLLAAGGGAIFMGGPPPVSLWNLDGSPVATLDADMAPDAIAFRPDGRYIAVGAPEGTVLIWDMQGMLVKEIPNPGKPFRDQGAALAWSPDLVTIVVAEGFCP